MWWELKYKKYLVYEKTIHPKSIGIGALIFFLITATTLYTNIDSFYSLFIFMISLFIFSFVASYTSGVKYKTGSVNGVLAVIIGASLLFSLMAILNYLNHQSINGIFFDSYMLVGLIIFIIILPLVLGLLEV